MSKVKVFDMAEGLSIPARKVTTLVTVGGVDSEITLATLSKGEHKSIYDADLPTNKVPTINDNGFVLHESNAITRYLAAKYAPELYPADLAKRAKIDEALEYLRSTVEPAVAPLGFHKYFLPLIGKDVSDEKVKEVMADIDAKLALFGKQYFQSEKKFLVNDELSIADTAAFSSLHHLTAESAAFDWSKYPIAKKYYDGLKAHEKFAGVDKVLAGFAETTK